jgi:RNA recognition motif-containing protein
LSDYRLIAKKLLATTSENTLKDYFSQFGDVEDVSLPLTATNTSRTYAFITFSHYKTFPIINLQHTIDGKVVEVSKLRPFPRDTICSNTILLGGVLNKVSKNALETYFSKFGEIKEIRKPKERRNQTIRSTHIVFKHESSAEEACKKVVHLVKNQIIDIRRSKEECNIN